MRIAVAIAASILMLAAFAARASTERPAESLRRTPAPAEERPRVVAPAAGAVRGVGTIEASTSPVKALEPSLAAYREAKTGGPGVPDPRTIAGQLARELGLSPVQRSSVESILADREREIEAYFAEIRARKVHTLEDWSRRMTGIKEGSYRRIEMLLDARQAQAFRALLERRALNDTIAFRIPDDVTNMDDFKE